MKNQVQRKPFHMQTFRSLAIFVAIFSVSFNNTIAAQGVKYGFDRQTSNELIQAALMLAEQENPLYVDSIVKALLIGQRYDEAIALAKGFGEWRDRSIGAIGDAQIANGHLEMALDSFRQIAEDSSRDRRLGPLVKQFALRGLAQNAEHAAALIQDNSARARALHHVVVAFAELGKDSKTLSLALSLPDNAVRYALEAAAAKFAAQEDFTNALRLSSLIESPVIRSRALLKIARAMFKAGDRTAAQSAVLDSRATARTIKDRRSRSSHETSAAIVEAIIGPEKLARKRLDAIFESDSWSWDELAPAYSSIGAPLTLSKILKRIETYSQSEVRDAESMVYVAKALTRTDLEVKKELLRKASMIYGNSSSSLRGYKLSEVALEQIAINDVGGAIDTAILAEWDHERREILLLLACRLIQSKQISESLLVVPHIKGLDTQSDVLLTVASTLVKEGTQRDIAKKAMDEARHLIQWNLPVVAMLEVKLDELQSAKSTLATALSIESTSGEFLARLALVQFALGQPSATATLNRAIEAVTSIEGPRYRAVSLINVANAIDSFPFPNICREKVGL